MCATMKESHHVCKRKSQSKWWFTMQAMNNNGLQNVETWWWEQTNLDQWFEVETVNFSFRPTNDHDKNGVGTCTHHGSNAPFEINSPNGFQTVNQKILAIHQEPKSNKFIKPSNVPSNQCAKELLLNWMLALQTLLLHRVWLDVLNVYCSLVSLAKFATRQPKSNILRMMLKDIPLQACGEHVKVNQSKMTTTLSLQMNVQVSKIQAKSSSKCMLGRLLENVNQQQTSLCAAAFQFLKQGTNCLRKIRYKKTALCMPKKELQF